MNHSFAHNTQEEILISTRKRLFMYIVFLIIAVFMLDVILYCEQLLKEEAALTFERLPFLLFTTLYPVLIGLVFALPTFIQTCVTKGSWTFDWLPFTVLGIPALLMDLIFLVYFYPVEIDIPLSFFAEYGSQASIICGLAFGYLALSCWKKKAAAAVLSL